VNLTLTLTMLAALSIVREGRALHLARPADYPSRRGSHRAGQAASYFVFGLLLFAALTALAAALFATPLERLGARLAAALFMTAKPGAWSGDSAARHARRCRPCRWGRVLYLPSILL